MSSRRHITPCFIATETELGRLAGYYTLAATGIPLTSLPREVAKRLPRYPTVPAVRIGRLAVDQGFQGRGLGAALLADAAQRTLVDAENDRGVAFYEHHRFIAFTERPRTLFLPIATAAKILISSASGDSYARRVSCGGEVDHRASGLQPNAA